MTVTTAASILLSAISRVGRFAGFIAALSICLTIAGTCAQASADTGTESSSTQSRETSASSNVDRASTDSVASNSSPDSDSGKADNDKRSSSASRIRESEGDSESRGSGADDHAPESADDADGATAADGTDSTGGSTEVIGTDATTETPASEAPAPEGTDVSQDTDVSDEAAAATPEPAPAPVATPPQSDSPATVSTPGRVGDIAPAGARAAVAAVEAPKPDFFTWIQRTFFNRTPTVSFDPDNQSTQADGTIIGSVIGADADGDVLTYSAGRPAGGGTVTIDGNGRFVYTPTAGFTSDGTDLFTVTVSDDAEVNGWRVHGLLGFLIPGWGSTATTTVGVGAATTAGGRYGWGTPQETRFTDPQALANGWYVYDSPGHNGWGRRTPEAISFVDGAMVITGDAAGNTAGLAWDIGQMYGAWEVRVKVPEGAADYHAVALLWPDAENWPVGGEIDFMEILGDSERQTVSHFLHYSAQNLTESAATEVDATQWHNYAVSWTPDAITIYIDGVPVFRSTTRSRFPPGPMHLALQLDASEKRPPDLRGGAQMSVAWARQYTLGQIS